MTERLTHDQVRSRTRMAGDVMRYHEWPVEKQSVAHHSWNCMRIYLEVFRPNLGPGGDEAGGMLAYLLYHDCGELGVGDLPYPVKRDLPELKLIIDYLEDGSLKRQGVVLPVLDSQDLLVAKVCDNLEMFEYGLEQVRRGNVYGQPVCDVMEEALIAALHRAEKPRLLHDDAQSLKRYFHRLTGRYLT